MGEPKVITGLNVALNALFADYVFSTFLSSPLTVETLYQEKKETVYKYMAMASGLSIAFSIIISWLFKNVWGIVTAIVFVTIIDSVYVHALSSFTST